ncbi:MAG: EAL domain-containing protein [Sedimenticolaceae bacterium]
MNFPGFRAGSTTILVAGLLLSIYLAALIGLGNVGQVHLREAVAAQAQRSIEEQASAVADFLNAGREALLELADSESAQAVFVVDDPDALGRQEPDADLAALLLALEQAVANQVIDERPVFDRIACVSDNGDLLHKVGEGSHSTADQTYSVHRVPRLDPLVVAGGTRGTVLTITVPVIVNGQPGGYLSGDIDTRGLLHKLSGLPAWASQFGHTALLGPGDELVAGSDSHDWNNWRAVASDRGHRLQLADIGDTGLRIVRIDAGDDPRSFIASPLFLVALALVSLPMLGGVTFLLALNNRYQALQTRFDALAQQHGLLHQQNERLQREIDKRVESEQKLAHQANYDQLTGLPNRSLAMDRLSQAIKWAKREGGSVITLFVDLDRFKHVNDSLGHAAGDELLRDAAQRLQARMRDSDTVSRLGGDEFLVICPETPGSPDWEQCAEQLLQAMSEPFYVHDHEFFVGASIGVATYPKGGKEPQMLVKNADIAMYAAKEMGRNRCCHYDPSMDAAALEGMRIERNLRSALRKQEFRLAFQPIVDLSSGRTVAVEALLRWKNAELGEVPADKFIPIAEECGLIHDIGEWVLIEACRVVSELQPDHDFRVAINLSSRQFSHPSHLLDCVLLALRRSGLMPNQLELEITEAILIDDRAEIAKLIDQLDRIGVRLSLDDFGTGYSALNYLQRFPFDALKIDRSFTKQLPDSDANASLIRAIIAMAHALGLEVIAEGIERREQAGFLLVYHCELGQGHLYSEPMSAEQLRLHLIDPQAISA